MLSQWLLAVVALALALSANAAAARRASDGLPATLELRGPALRAEVSTAPWRLQVRGPDGRPLWQEPGRDGEYGAPAFQVNGQWEQVTAVQSFSQDAQSLTLHLTTTPSGLPAEVTLTLDGLDALRVHARLLEAGATRAAVSAQSPADEKLLGFGERFTGVNQRGRTVRIWAEDRRAVGYGDSTYLPIPFFLSSRGYSFLLDGFARATIAAASARPDALAAIVDGPEIGFTLTYGPTPAALVEAYAHRTGLPPLPPPWAFGVVKTTIGGQARALADAQRLRALGAPVSGLYVYDLMDPESDVGWAASTYGTLQPGPYPDPRALADQVHALGYKLFGYFSPDFHVDRPTYTEPDAAGYLVRSPEGGSYRDPRYNVSWLDFTNPLATAWWQAKVRRALVDLDLDGGMLDLGELLPEDARFSDGRDGVAEHNAYPLLYHRAAVEEAQRSKPDAIFWMRSGATGDQHEHAVTWSGDPIDSWDAVSGIRSLVPAALSAGLSGYPYWYTEVSGYVQHLPRDQERQLWFRWLELGAFTSMLRDGYGDKPDHPVDAWSDDETMHAYLRYAAIHQQLAPYLYSLAREASTTGLPLLRHYVLQYPDDPASWDVEDAYLLGPDLLVAPILDQDADGRGVHFPPGEWVDFWSGQRISGGGDVYVSADLHTIPVFLRAGAVLPRLAEGVRSLAEPGWDDTLVLQVVPASATTSTSLTLFDGGTLTATVGPDAAEVEVSGGRARTYQVLLPGGAPQVLAGQLLASEPLAGGGVRVTVRGAAIRVRGG